MRALLLVPFLLARAVEGQTSLPLTLEDALARARAASPGLGRFQALQDAAGESLRGARAQRLPQIDLLAGYTRMGFDLVAYSGGKAIRGPNDTGLLLGRRALIQAAALNTNPNCGTIGRGLKVSKEDMIACMTAVERFVRGVSRAAQGAAA